MYVIYSMIEWFVFFLVIFLYIHILQQYKYSDENDVYEMDYIDNTNLQDSCQLLQPIVFATQELLPSLPTLDDAIGEVGSDNLSLGILDELSSKYATPFPYKLAMNLLNMSTSAKKYYSEHNESLFLQAAPEYKDKIKELDTFLRPPFTVQSHHDVCIGAKDACTPFRYHIHSRKFLVVQSGKITVKMTPWKKYAKYLHEIRDYELGEYRSNMNVWNPKEHHRREFDKIEFVEFDVDIGHILSIPSYWGYSIQYQESTTCYIEYTYSTCFNQLAFLGETARIWLQNQNTYQTWFRTVPNKEKIPTIVPEDLSTSPMIDQTHSVTKLPAELVVEGFQPSYQISPVDTLPCEQIETEFLDPSTTHVSSLVTSENDFS